MLQKMRRIDRYGRVVMGQVRKLESKPLVPRTAKDANA